MLDFDVFGFIMNLWDKIREFGTYLVELLNKEINLSVNFMKIGDLPIGTQAFFEMTHLPSKFSMMSMLGVGLVGFMTIRLIKKLVPLA